MDERLDRLAALLREEARHDADRLADLIDQSAAELEAATSLARGYGMSAGPTYHKIVAMAHLIRDTSNLGDEVRATIAATLLECAREQTTPPPPDVFGGAILASSKVVHDGEFVPPPDVAREALEAENRRLREALEGIRTHAEQEILDWRADREEGGGSPCYEVNRWSAVIAAIGKANALATKEPTDV